MPSRNNRHAFSLVELSIVLVILGLLVGGVLSGKSLIRAAELRAIPTEFNNYLTAMRSFRDKYFYYPGDMPNAYAFWGAACGTDTVDAGTGCNGNGDGYIWTSLAAENVKAWEHLSRAGMITGNYDGAGTLDSGRVILAKNNSPASRFPETYWGFAHDWSEWGDNGPLEIRDSDIGNYLQFGVIQDSYSPIYTHIPGIQNLTVGEAWQVDTKMDDGHACTGNVRGQNDDERQHLCDNGASTLQSYRIVDWNGVADDPDAIIYYNMLTFIAS